MTFSHGALAALVVVLAPSAAVAAQAVGAPGRPPAALVLQASGMRIEMTCRPGALWTIRPVSSAPAHAIAPPVFPLDGRVVTALPARLERVGEPVPVGPDVLEHTFSGALRDDDSLALEVRFRLSDLSPIVRFRYRLTATRPHVFSRGGAEDELVYLRAGFDGLPRATEVRLSEWVERLQASTLAERTVAERDFDAGLGVTGPILIGSDGRRTLLLAYEHGSQAADAFVRFDLAAGRGVTLRAVKGSSWRGQPLDAAHPYDTLWLQAGLVAGDERRAAAAYRRFVREDLAGEPASRQPRLHFRYRTSNLRAPDRGRGGPDGTSTARVLAEIDAAHRIGVETFVLEGGWAGTTGDWSVSRTRFPEGLGPIRSRLEGYGMRLGLRLDPTAAAASSHAYAAHRGHGMSWRGAAAGPDAPGAEASHPMCLVSPWGDAFLEALVRLNSETGVTSYEWGAVAQYGCDAPGHGHGTDANTPEERADAYAFRIAPRLAGIAERLAQRVPGSVVDLDVTGPGRPVGLAFLRAGRYSLVASRSTYGYDEWIPSELFLTHALPDDPLDAQLVGVASLILAHGGMRGSLRTVPENGAAFLARVVGLWREVRDSMSGASPVRTTVAGGSGEVHEKIDADGRGAIVVFSAAAGRRRYVSEHVVVPDHWATPGVQVRSDGAGHAVLDLSFEKPGAAIVFFGATGARQVEVR